MAQEYNPYSHTKLLQEYQADDKIKLNRKGHKITASFCWFFISIYNGKEHIITDDKSLLYLN